MSRSWPYGELRVPIAERRRVGAGRGSEEEQGVSSVTMAGPQLGLITVVPIAAEDE